jgi:hypothetical protein
VVGIRRVLTAENGGTSRALGGLLVAAGTIALLTRRTTFEDPWSDFVVVLILAVLAKSLFWSGFFGARWSDATRPWQAIFLLLGIALTPSTLYVFVEWVGGDADAPLNLTWIFLFTAAAASLALFGARVRVAGLLAAVALVVAWVAVWHELLDDGVFDDINSLRWVLLAAAALLLPIAGAVSGSRAPEGSASDVVTVAGLSAVVAGAIVFLLPNLFIVAAGFEGETPTSLFWDLELLIVSLGLIAFAGAGALSRGPGYLGAFGIAAFAFSVGFDLDDSSPAGTVLGWPLILLVLGAALVLASVWPEIRRRRT